MLDDIWERENAANRGGIQQDLNIQMQDAEAIYSIKTYV